MPPSGYSTRSADGLVVFLREAVTDLRAEVEAGKHASLEVALRYEVSQISKALCSSDCEVQEKALLLLTHSFYQEALNVGEVRALEDARVRVLAIHIDDMGTLAKK